MNLTPELSLAFFRGLVTGLLGVLAGLAVQPLLAHPRTWARNAAWAVLLAPYLTPAPLVGYAYSNFSLSLVHHPLLNEVFYVLVLTMKLIPVAAIVLHFGPSRLSPEALHCHRLLREGESSARSLLSTVALTLRGHARAGAVAFGLVFLFAFAEFEMASLLGVKCWTVSLFDAQVGGLAISESLKMVLLPTICEAGLLLLMMVFLFAGKPPALQTFSARRPRKRWSFLIWSLLAAQVIVVTLVPLSIVMRGTVKGLAAVMERFVLGADIGASLVFATAAAVCSYLLASLFARMARAGGYRLAWTYLLCVPGLLGALVLSLFVLWAFQQPGLRQGYDTPLPLFITMTLLLLPFAVLLRMLLAFLRSNESLHAAELLTASSSASTQRRGAHLVRTIRTRGRFWVIFLLFCWGYFDLTASSLLAPSKMTPVFVRLYNQMHYGQMAVLSAMVCVAFSVPFIVLALAGAARSLAVRWVARG